MKTNLKILLLTANIIFAQFRWLSSKERALNCDNKTGHYPNGIVELTKNCYKMVRYYKRASYTHKPSGAKIPTSHNVEYSFMVEIKNKSERKFKFNGHFVLLDEDGFEIDKVDLKNNIYNVYGEEYLNPYETKKIQKTGTIDYDSDLDRVYESKVILDLELSSDKDTFWKYD